MSISMATTQQVVDALRAGRPAIFPTDTVYGLGLCVESALSPHALFELKGRSDSKPVAWLVAGVESLFIYGEEAPEGAVRLARAFWPGPLTLIVKASDRVPRAFRSEFGTIGLRMPDSPTALGLVEAAGSPLATTSANKSGDSAPLSLEDVDTDLARAVGVVLSDDLPRSGLSSTVVDCTGADPVVLREGSITSAQIAACWKDSL